ncbi:hypothetical protein [Streptomyces cucumeris]|uniref:hypothetical protein n=1 Tax=Streptomyces cucumeris TaxID=2962890 RepID=UPI0020C89BED|nr:hypothetical protein [Streptomyces sp. NEAU-Y11]MCP9213313.1 hypothetical protein [Streptomyces sp. NEAU-Y11]
MLSPTASPLNDNVVDGEAEEPRVGKSEEQYQGPDGADDAWESFCREATAQLLNPLFLFDERLRCGDAWGRHAQI